MDTTLEREQLDNPALVKGIEGTAAEISHTYNVLGALLPLCVGALLPGHAWLKITVGLLALSVLGVAAPRVAYGNPTRWARALVLAGGLLTLVGLKLGFA